MNKCISVIVPAYCAENSIERCLNSICQSTIKELEVIVVDNRSDDRTKDKVFALMKQDARIQYYLEETAGVSNARNLGLQKASGEYIAFVDADDYVEPNHFERLLRDGDIELSVINFYHYDEDNKKKSVNPFVSEGNYSIMDIATDFWYFYDCYVINPVWNKLYRKEMIDKAQLYFVSNQFMGEDALFNLSYLKNCQKITIINEATYAYSFHSDQTIFKANPNYFSNIMRLYDEIAMFLNDFHEFVPNQGEYEERLYREVLRSVSKVCQTRLSKLKKVEYLKVIVTDKKVQALLVDRRDPYAFLLRHKQYSSMILFYQIYQKWKGVRYGK